MTYESAVAWCCENRATVEYAPETICVEFSLSAPGIGRLSTAVEAQTFVDAVEAASIRLQAWLSGAPIDMLRTSATSMAIPTSQLNTQGRWNRS